MPVKTRYTVALSMIAGAALGAAAVQGVHAQAKPPVHAVAEITVTNLDAYIRKYAPLAQAGIKTLLLAVGQNVTSLEGAPAVNRVSIQQWDSPEKL